jgi:Family of unknown function (DUF5761)
MNNGRVDTINNANYQMHGLFENGNNKLSEFSHEAIQGIHTKTPLNDLFFRPTERSNGEFIIGNQSEVELQVIMRAVYLNEAKHIPYDIVNQVVELNKSILDYCVPRILEEVRMYKHYKQDVSQLPMPLDRGQFSSAKGMRVLESKQF